MRACGPVGTRPPEGAAAGRATIEIAGVDFADIENADIENNAAKVTLAGAGAAAGWGNRHRHWRQEY
jgi:hypothetical protein